MEREDVHDDGTEDEQAEVARARDGDEDAAEHFQHLDEGQVARGAEGGHEVGRRRAFRRGRRGDELEQDDDAGGGEEKAEKDAGSDGDVFQEFVHGWKGELTNILIQSGHRMQTAELFQDGTELNSPVPR